MSEKSAMFIKPLKKYDPDTVYIGAGDYVAECVPSDDGEFYLAEDVDAVIEALQAEIERLRREREVLMEALMPAREALADLDKGHYRVARRDPGGYVMGNVSVVSLVTVIESTRKALALFDGEKGGGA